ncbi:uncharacterized protein LOC120368312 [Saimiri boliviensis]|uniref:uncharacterized protein LOC120368312 n=1 Tax=Saimiri boliviensis TaxID=27679 RepID=UPI003D76B4F4
MAVRHLGELKKKKKKTYRARAEVEIHESTYAVSVHLSQAPEAWTPENLRKVASRIPGAGPGPPPPTAIGAGGALSAEQEAAREPGDLHPGPASLSPDPRPSLPPQDVHSKPHGFNRTLGEPHEAEKGTPTLALAGACPLPQPGHLD